MMEYFNTNQFIINNLKKPRVVCPEGEKSKTSRLNQQEGICNACFDIKKCVKCKSKEKCRGKEEKHYKVIKLFLPGYESIVSIRELEIEESRKQIEETRKQICIEKYRTAQLHMSKDNVSYAKKLLYECMQIPIEFTDKSGVYVSLANILIHENTCSIDAKKEEIHSLLDKAILLKPSNIIAPAVFVNLYYIQKNFEMAIYWLHRCNNQVTISFLSQDFIRLMRDNKESLTCTSLEQDNFFKRLEDLGYRYIDESCDLCTNLAICYMQSNQEFRAYDVLKKVLEMAKNDVHKLNAYLQLSVVLCQGYLDQPRQQEVYCREGIECVKRIMNDIGKGRIWSVPVELKDIYWQLEGNLAVALKLQKKYEDALQLTSRRIKEKPNNTDLHNHAVILYRLKRYDDSLKYLKENLYSQEDEVTYGFIARNYYAKGMYETAAMFYIKAISFVDENPDECIETKEGGAFERKDWKVKKQLEYYDELIDTYYQEKEYINAKSVCLLVQKKLGNTKEIERWNNTLDHIIELVEQKEAIEKKCDEIEQKLIDEKNNNQASYNRNLKWKIDLMKLQGDEIDIEGENFAKEMDKIINKMKRIYRNDSFINKINKEFKLKYSCLETKSLEFLKTAEFLYYSNQNTNIDFAPIMVEFCKVIENELREILKEPSATLGKCIHILKTKNIPHVSNIYEDLKNIYEFRNGSAHTGISTKEKVNIVRELLFDKNVLATIQRYKLNNA